MLESLQTQLYKLEQFANALVSTQLTHLGWVSIGVIFAAGLLTSLTLYAVHAAHHHWLHWRL